jgi:hypothetical protein
MGAIRKMLASHSWKTEKLGVVENWRCRRRCGKWPFFLGCRCRKSGLEVVGEGKPSQRGRKSSGLEDDTTYNWDYLV